jgi:nitrite reductase (NADH) small subunit
MPFIKAGAMADLPPDSVQETMVEGHPYAISRVDGEVFALDGVCPHRSGPLGQGQIHESRVVSSGNSTAHRGERS